MAHLSLSFLGPFQALLNEQPITGFRSVKNQALLAWLALETKRAVSRASVAGLCWPEEPEQAARLNLRQALFQLRSVLQAGKSIHEKDHLLVTAQTVQFDLTAAYSVDLFEFNALFEQCATHAHPALDRCAECSERLVRAVELYRGEFLQGLFVNDSAPLEEWILWRRQQFQHHVLLALRTLATWCEQQGDFARVHHYAQRQLAIDTLQEDAYQQLMRGLALAGRRQEALVAYERCRKILQDELGVEPSAATQQLYAQIKAESWPVAPPRPTISIADPPSPPPPIQIQEMIPVNYSFPEKFCTTSSSAKMGQNFSGDLYHNLPPSPNRFVGRQAELRAVSQQLHDPACRLITVLGPGGVGKTRFSLALAETIREWRPDSVFRIPPFPDGVWFIPLAGVSQPAQLPQAIAASLGVRLEGQGSPRQELIDYLRPKQLLLVLDNYEHLLADAALVNDLLQAVPASKIVVTSRERLNFQKEWLFELQGLPYPRAVHSHRHHKDRAESLDASGVIPANASTEEATEEGAVRLFLDRVQRIGHSVATAEHLPEIQRICQLVEGYPLGIELAAALASILPLAEIATEIATGIDVLATTMGDIPDRHRSLRAVFDSSWERLSLAEQRVLARLAVFRGGFDWAAAQAVAQSTRLDLAGLLGKSMLSLTTTGRYAIHELLRQYAWARLDAAEIGTGAIHNAHARYFANFAQVRKEQLQGGAQKQALAELDHEIGNLRVAWAWAVQQQDAALLNQFCRGLAIFYESQGLLSEAETAFGQAIHALRLLPQGKIDQRVLIHLLVQRGHFCRLQSHFEEAKRLLIQAIDLLKGAQLDQTPDGQAHLAEAYNNLGLLWHLLGDNRQAQQQLAQAISLSRAIHAPWLTAEGLGSLALVVEFGGQPAVASQLLQESLSIQRSLQDLRAMATTMNRLGFLYVNQADYARAELMLQQCLVIQRDLGDHLGVANTLNSLGAAAITQGDYAAAKRYHRESLAIYRQYNEQGGILRNLGNLGYAYNRSGEYAAALEVSTQALAMDRTIGSPRSMAFTLRHLGETYLGLGDIPQSRHSFQQALVMALDIDETPLVLLVLNAMAQLWMAEGHLLEAVERLTFVLHHPASEGKVQAQARRTLAKLTSHLPAGQVAQATERSQQLTLETLVKSALLPVSDVAA